MAIHRLLIILGSLVALGAGCASRNGDPRENLENVATTTAPIDVSAQGLSYYCNQTGNNGGWTFSWGGANPCGTPSPGWTIARAGFYSTNGLNNVVATCTDGAQWEFDGYGTWPLSQAFNSASGHGSTCTFTVSPQRMAVFHLPYRSSDLTGHGNPFDFNRDPYEPPEPTDGGTLQMDYKGEIIRYEDEHNANDFGLTRGNNIYAAADGVVLTAGHFPGSVYPYASPPQQNPNFCTRFGAVKGTNPPAVTVDGWPDAGPGSIDGLEIDITQGGPLGTAQFQWKYGGVLEATGVPTAADVTLGTTGLTAHFTPGCDDAGQSTCYNTDNVYASACNASTCGCTGPMNSCTPTDQDCVCNTYLPDGSFAAQSHTGRDCGEESIVRIKHTVSVGAANPTYDEVLLTGYYHMQNLGPNIPVCDPSGDTSGCCGPGKTSDCCSPVASSSFNDGIWRGGDCVGVSASQGDVVGNAGARGLANGTHVHFATWRLTNTAATSRLTSSDPNGGPDGSAPTSITATRTIPDSYVTMPFGGGGGLDGNSNGDTLAIEPAGWSGYPTFDPWSYKAYASQPGWLGGGALSINLWAVAHPRIDFGPTNPPPLWTSVPGCATAVGSGWVIGCGFPYPDPGGDGIYQWDLAGNTWHQIPNSFGVAISVDLNGNPWVINSSGLLYKWNGSGFSAFPVFDGNHQSFAISSVASGSMDTETWVVRKSDGSIWNWSALSVWRQVPGAFGIKVAVFSDTHGACGHVPWVINAQTNVYQYSPGAYSPGAGCALGTFSTPDPSAFAVDISTDFVVGTSAVNGSMFQWDPLANTFNSSPPGSVQNCQVPNPSSNTCYAPTAWGTCTKIGTGVNGIFAVDVTCPDHVGTGAIQTY